MTGGDRLFQTAGGCSHRSQPGGPAVGAQTVTRQPEGRGLFQTVINTILTLSVPELTLSVPETSESVPIMQFCVRLF